jgi:hypothetical protein
MINYMTVILQLTPHKIILSAKMASRRCTGFDRGLPVEEIVGLSTKNCGQDLLVVVKWRGRVPVEAVSLADAKQNCPEKLIDYLQRHLNWPSSDDESPSPPADHRPRQSARTPDRSEQQQRQEGIHETPVCRRGRRTDEATRQPMGFERGLRPKKIIGATNKMAGDLMYLMVWEGTDEADLVPARQAIARCPQVVLKFLLQRVNFMER